MEREWGEDFLYQLEGWVDRNQTIVELNGYLLMVCQLFFVIGVSTGVSALLGMDTRTILYGVVGLFAVVVAVLLGLRYIIRNR